MTETTLFEVLETALRQRGWSIPQFARACGVSVQLAYKWLAEDETARITPGPASCEKIAKALGLDADYVLELAGHRTPPTDRAPVDHDAAALLAVWPNLEDRIQYAIRILAGLHPVSEPGQSGVTAAKRKVTRTKRARGGELPNCLPIAKLALALAR